MTEAQGTAGTDCEASYYYVIYYLFIQQYQHAFILSTQAERQKLKGLLKQIVRRLSRLFNYCVMELLSYATITRHSNCRHKTWTETQGTAVVY